MWGVLPAFVLLTIVSIVICSALLVAAAGKADFCGAKDSTPDHVVLDFLVKAKILSPEQYAYKASEYFVFQCTDKAAEDPLLLLRQYGTDIVCYL